MRGRLDSRFWVAGHGSSTKFGKVVVTDVAPAVGITPLLDCAKLAVNPSRFEHLESRIEERWRF
jgi:hypothetical protein